MTTYKLQRGDEPPVVLTHEELFGRIKSIRSQLFDLYQSCDLLFAPKPEPEPDPVERWKATCLPFLTKEDSPEGLKSILVDAYRMLVEGEEKP